MAGWAVFVRASTWPMIWLSAFQSLFLTFAAGTTWLKGGNLLSWWPRKLLRPFSAQSGDEAELPPWLFERVTEAFPPALGRGQRGVHDHLPLAQLDYLRRRQ